MKHEEDKLLMQCVGWFKYQYPEPKYLIHHSPSEGKRNVKINKYGRKYSPEATRLKLKGTRAGFPDLIIVSDLRILFIEMKSDKGRLNDNQREVFAMMGAMGFPVAIVNSFELFVDAVERWMNG